jgi:hypothetical protein
LRKRDDGFQHQGDDDREPDGQQDRIGPAQERDEAEEDQGRHAEQRGRGQGGERGPEDAALAIRRIGGVASFFRAGRNGLGLAASLSVIGLDHAKLEIIELAIQRLGDLLQHGALPSGLSVVSPGAKKLRDWARARPAGPPRTTTSDLVISSPSLRIMYR